MSIITTVYLRECIVMAADSRITGTCKNIDGNFDRLSLSDNGQKIFLLKNRTIGVSACGDQELDGRTIADFMRKFEINEIKAEDTVKEVAEKLCDYVKGKHIGDVVFHVCGYQEEIRNVIEVINDKFIIRLDEKNQDECNAIWSGEPQALSNLMSGEKAIPIEWNFMYMKDGIDFAEFLIDTTCKIHRFQSGLGTCGGPIDILLLTKDCGKWIRHKVFKP